MYIHIKKLRVYPLAILLTSLVTSIYSPVYADDTPHEQTFVVTAYYSPLPDQCCYFRGSYEEDIIFNGKGTHGADGTPVYPGMIAGPPTYPLGTVIDLPGVGVGTIHDRGGRIIEWGDDIHRIDLWMGYGEEGLARALVWGARKVTGTVYPLGYPGQPRESIALGNFDADSSALAGLPKSDPTLLMSSTKLGDNEYAVRILQNTLKNLGYFSETPNGNFGPATKSALGAFLQEYGMDGDGSAVNRTIAAALTVAESLSPENLPDVPEGLHTGSNGESVRQIQKLLRYLGFYRGRTDGEFGDALRDSVLAFQVSQGLISSPAEPGAGRVGPGTKAAILRLWKANIVGVKAVALAMKMDVTTAVREEKIPKKVLSKGDHGAEVRVLQRILQDLGYLAQSDTTGTFGSRTADALLQYQREKNIVDSATDKGAGVYGPATKNVLLHDVVSLAWQRVRADGIGAL